MPDSCKRILSSFTWRKQQKAWNKTKEKYMPVKRKQNLAETDMGSHCNQKKWLEEFLDNTGAFYNGNESDDSDNEDENYNENDKQQQLSHGLANICYKIDLSVLLQDLINDSAVCKHCSRTLTC